MIRPAFLLPAIAKTEKAMYNDMNKEGGGVEMGSVIIIGGGAAGLAAAVAAAMCGDRVTVLERMDRVGKKILATGNGRCNLMNTGELRFPGGGDFAQAVLKRCGAKEQERFWAFFGLRLRHEEGGRAYPVSGAATTVLDTLRQAMRALDVQEKTSVCVDGISRAKGIWTVHAGSETFRAERVIIAGGGCAQPKLGSDGSTWKLLSSLGHTLARPRPALTQITTDTEWIRGLSGIRARTGVRILRGNQELHREAGEVLFADYGLTGVCIMQCARHVRAGDEISIDMTRAMGLAGAEEFRAELQRRRKLWSSRSAGSIYVTPVVQRDLLTGLCVPKLAIALFRAAGLERTHEAEIADLTNQDVDRLVRCAADFRVTVRGVKGFENAQVTAGGADVREFDPETMASKIAPGIHAAGEVLDVDGDCGGYNLMFAFGSGILAGLNGRECPW